jgi:ABC-type glycerol-3-phosphate transport system substrate-binding protein
MSKKKFSRRDFLKTAAVTATGTLIASCTPAATEAPQEAPMEEAEEKVDSAPPASEEIILDWWPGWPSAAMTAIAKHFEDENPGVKVKIGQFYPEGAQLMAAVASGTPPDIVSDIPYLEIIARGVCLPLDEYIAASNVVALDDADIPKLLFDIFKWEDNYYGVPAVETAGRQGMGFNLDMCDQAGLDADNLPETWDEVFEWHKAITTYDSAGNLETLGMNPMAERLPFTSYGDPWCLPHMWGFNYISDDLKYDIDRPETAEFLNVINMFYEDVGVEKMDALQAGLSGIPRGPFGVGKQAMQICWHSGVASVWNTNPTQEYKFTYVPIPSNRKGTTIQTGGGHSYVIMKDAKEHDTAFKLAEYMTLDTACNLLFEAFGWFSPRKSWRETLDLSGFPELVQESLQFYPDSLGSADEVWYVRDPIEGITQTEWQKAYEGVIYGEFGAEEAAKTMQENLTKELALFMEERG